MPGGGYTMTVWTAELVEERLRAAMLTLKAMPSDRPMGHRIMWPGVPKDTRDAMLAYGYYGDPENRYRKERQMPDLKVLPSSADIDRLDVCLGWLYWLDKQDRIIVSAVSRGVTKTKLARLFGQNRLYITQRYRKCCRNIASRLNGQVVS